MVCNCPAEMGGEGEGSSKGRIRTRRGYSNSLSLLCYFQRKTENLFSDVGLRHSALMTEPLKRDKTSYCSGHFHLNVFSV